FFMRSPRVQNESAVLAGYFSILNVLPPRALHEAVRTLPGISRGQGLCHAFEAYRDAFPTGSISFEHAVTLYTALARGDEIECSHCSCGALCLADRLALREIRCGHCAEAAAA